MPDNYPNVRFRPSQTTRDALDEQNLTLQDAIDVAQQPGASWDAKGPNHKWHRSVSQSGRELKVLVEDLGVGGVVIKAVHDIAGGG